MRSLVIAAILALSSAAFAKPPTVEERRAEQREREADRRQEQAEERAERARERREAQDDAREERQRTQEAKRSARDLGLDGQAKRRYVKLHSKR